MSTRTAQMSHESESHVVMVTGGSGLVGSAIRAAVEGESKVAGETWVFLGSRDGDLTSAAATRAIFERVRPTHVIHLAAKVGGLFNNMRHKVEFYRDNCKINDNVMECCREFKVGGAWVCGLGLCGPPTRRTHMLACR